MILIFQHFKALKTEKLLLIFVFFNISPHERCAESKQRLQKVVCDAHSAVTGRSVVGCVSFIKSNKRWQPGEEQCCYTAVLVCNLYLICCVTLCSVLFLLLGAEDSAVMRSELWPPGSWMRSITNFDTITHLICAHETLHTQTLQVCPAVSQIFKFMSQIFPEKVGKTHFS